MAVGQGRKRFHASHLTRMDKIRKEFWSSYRPRQEIEAFREQLVANQKRAENVNALRHMEGLLADTTRNHRLGYIQRERDKMLQSLNVADSKGLL